jgi:subtilisin family serine protease
MPQNISMSLGGYGLSIVLHLACDYARYIKGVLLVAAAGNDGLPILCFPARFESVISVGAIDKNLNLCSWSNYGPNLDLVAPGNNIISTVEGNNYEKLSGTSMATPHVAAVSALYFSSNYGASATLCEIKLYSTAMDLGSPGNDWKYGYGLVDAYGVVKKTRNISNNSQLLRFVSGIPKLLMNMRFQ